ncbi:restriction endonuclease subunit S [Deinococcus soli (ex Cha et al. 2016)]|uniref:Uncharacterized protein n=2 Tax=Deinococcus soli (ex Cha et al. 2016) TaxID=1309411 RepID=A0ACC6KPK8_9DEIO|nr:restriction endonuclease subunit S [Deinococcus soli (ex Cha et al. 2016)]MDR6221295.1 hypothetical protein [Deinococcus soli (ex Cha et al. 2016)]MDR6331214.1 hypothetical protein [Deinococcus soli (ex Cha et al. 2016)]MDR6754431.1 hypothetical protein [Deinococcus soli (ex Cha et al. 2016)]
MKVVPLGTLGELMQGLPHRFSPSRDLVEQDPTDGPAFHLLSIGDITGLTVTPGSSRPVHLPRGTPTDRYTLRNGDVLLTIRTRPFRAAAVTDPDPLMIPTQNLAVLRPNPDILHGPYLATYLNTPEAQTDINGRYGQSAATPLLKLSSLAEIPIPLPPMYIQKQIADLALSFEEEEKATQALLAERRALVQRSIALVIHQPPVTTPERLL